MTTIGAFSITAPRFTAEQEEAERSSLSQEERDKVVNDLFGGNAHALPSAEEHLPQLVTHMSEELDKIDDAEKEGYLLALKQCPHLVAKESDPVRFLRCDDYQTEKAARRLVNYWNFRVELFGEERAFLPMTIRGAMADDMDGLQCAWTMCFIAPTRDQNGRAVLCCDRCMIDPKKFGRDRLLRLIFYTAFAASNHPLTQIHGAINVVYNSLHSMDRIFFKKWQKLLLTDILPIKFLAHHSVRNPAMVELLLPVIKWMLGKYDRLRTHVHGGSNVLANLAPFGITPDCLPTTIGGTHVFNEPAYIAARIKEEEGQINNTTTMDVEEEEDIVVDDDGDATMQ